MRKVFVNGRKVKYSDLSPRQVELENLLNEQKRLTAYWYARISGQAEWRPGEKEVHYAKEDALSVEIDRLIGLPEIAELCERIERD